MKRQVAVELDLAVREFVAWIVSDFLPEMLAFGNDLGGNVLDWMDSAEKFGEEQPAALAEFYRRSSALKRFGANFETGYMAGWLVANCLRETVAQRRIEELEQAAPVPPVVLAPAHTAGLVRVHPAVLEPGCEEHVWRIFKIADLMGCCGVPTQRLARACAVCGEHWEFAE